MNRRHAAALALTRKATKPSKPRAILAATAIAMPVSLGYRTWRRS
jgi:hypothetical protein